MEHAPIYRSAVRRTTTSRLPWQRTASLATAAVALTMSGIALGYHGFLTTEASPASGSTLSASTRLNATSADQNLAAPVPGVTFGGTDGGHPDVISTLSSALIAQFQAARVPILTLPVGPLVQPLVGPLPEVTTEAVVGPAMTMDPSSDATQLPLDLGAPPLVEDVVSTPLAEAVVAPDVMRALPVTVRPPAPVVAAADIQVATDEAPTVDAQPQEQTAAAVPADPPPAAAPVAPTNHNAEPAVHVATPQPVVPKPAALPAKPVVVVPVVQDDAPPPQAHAGAKKAEPPAAPPPPASHTNTDKPSNNQDKPTQGHPSDTKANAQPSKGKGNSDHGG